MPQITTEIIDDIIIDYLNRKDTNYAVLMSGKWGSGKTHYWKNALVPLLSTEKAAKRWIPIYVSLNGLEKTEQINRKIVNEYLRIQTIGTVNPEFLDKYKNTIASLSLAVSSMRKLVGEAISFGASSLHSIAKIDIRPENFVDFVNFDNLLICFDDLERYKGKTEVLGLINEFVEHRRAKVIILANEEKLQDTFKDQKEKVVGKTILFQPDCKKIIEEIIGHYDNGVHDFLSQNIESLLDILHRSKHLNFRIMRSALDDFVFLYQKVIEYDVNLLNCVKLPLLRHTLSIAIELRQGNLSKEQEASLQSANVSAAIGYHIKQKRNANDSLPFFMTFIDDYWGSSFEWNYWFSSVIEFLRTGVLDSDLFHEELNRFRAGDHSALDFLFNIGYWKMTDAQFNEKIKTQLMGDISLGKIHLPLYPKTFSYLFDLAASGLLGCTPDELEVKFQQGIDSILQTGQFENEIDEHDERFRVKEIPLAYFRIKEYAQAANDQLRKQLYNTKVIALFRLLPENVDEFTSKLLDEKEEFCYIPIFTFCKSTEIHQLLTQLPTEKIVKLRNALGERYKRTNLNISADYPILKEIGEKILADFPESSNQSLKGHLLRVLGESLIKEEPAQT